VSPLYLSYASRLSHGNLYLIVRACGRNIVVASQDWDDFGAGDVAVLGVDWETLRFEWPGLGERSHEFR